MTHPTIPTIHTYGGRRIPAPGRYELDPARTSVEFIARNLMITKVRGRFTDVTGTITVDRIPERSQTHVEIAVGSLTTGNRQRDAHLRSPDFFDADRFPTIAFQSTRVTSGTSGTWTVFGELTIRDITRPIHFDTTFDGAAHTPGAADRIGFDAQTEVNRYDWGIDYSAPLESGGLLIGRQVQIQLEVTALAP